MELNERYEDWVVVDDLDGEWNDGSLVKLATARTLTPRGVTLLPVDPQLLRVCGVGGYAKRSWGSGVPLDSAQPRLTCPIAVFATPLHRRLRWAVRLVAGENVAKRVADDQPFEGIVQLTADSGQRGMMGAGVRQEGAPFSARELGKLDDRGGWTVEGAAEVSLAGEGVHGFALYGNMPGVRVAWVAASLVGAA